MPDFSGDTLEEAQRQAEAQGPTPPADKWFETSHKSKGKDNRIVHQDVVGEVSISTVFLGLDHNFHNHGKKKPIEPPMLWETMIFGGEMDHYQRRYDSRDDAIVGHMQAVEKVKALNADIVELERMLKLDGDYTRTGI